jgi:HAMP domain-containing protein
VGMLLLALLLLTVIWLSNIYSYRVVTRNTVETFEAGTSLYVGSIHSNLETVTRSIAELAKASISDMQLYLSQPATKQYLLQVDWQSLLKKRMDFTKAVDFLFIVHPDEGLRLLASSSHTASSMKISAIDYLSAQKEYSNDALSEQWHVKAIGSMPCLIQTFKVAGFYIGGIVQFSTIFEYLPKTLLQKEVQYLLTDNQGRVIYKYGESYLNGPDKIDNQSQLSSNYKGKWFLLTEELKFARLTMARPNDAIYLGLEFSFYLILGLGVLCLAMILAGSFYIYSQIIRPVNELYMGTKQIEKGNLDYRVKEFVSPQEFAALTKSFNTMSKEIMSLKIESYEAEIQRRQNELRFLQMQIRPHFYLNAITTISSFAYQNRSDDLKG